MAAVAFDAGHVNVPRLQPQTGGSLVSSVKLHCQRAAKHGRSSSRASLEYNILLLWPYLGVGGVFFLSTCGFAESIAVVFGLSSTPGERGCYPSDRTPCECPVR